MRSVAKIALIAGALCGPAGAYLVVWAVYRGLDRGTGSVAPDDRLLTIGLTLAAVGLAVVIGGVLYNLTLLRSRRDDEIFPWRDDV